MQIIDLLYQADSSVYFKPLSHRPYSIWLDSCRPYQERGRFDIMVAEPVQIFESQSLEVLNQIQSMLQKYKTTQPKIEVPFTFGAMGYFSYDAGRMLENLNDRLPRDIPLPIATIGFYEWSLISDHELKKTYLIHRSHDTADIEAVLKLIDSQEPEPTPFNLAHPFENEMSFESYQKAFNAIQEHITQGDCYQVNLSQRFKAHYTGSIFSAYMKLREKSPAPFSAFMSLPQGAFLSLSPERFLQVTNGTILTQPIKGTSARYSDFILDQQSALALKNSVKDRAENLMIVDLLRNDLGRCSIPGSIQVPQLFELQSFSNVHHLVSSITARLKPDLDAIDLFKACFPGGSITGAPKISAMNIIENHEAQARSLYCGSLCYFSVDGKMDSNIAIRSLIAENSNLYAYAGGAIVADSDCNSEYQECLLKINNLLRTL